MQSITMKWVGKRPMLMHNGRLADPMDEYTRAIKKMTAKGSKKMTDDDHAERDKQEWMGSLYWDEQAKGLYIPSDNVNRCIIDGARNSRLGKDFSAGVIVDDCKIKLHHRMSGKSMAEIYANPAYTMRKGVSVNESRVIRVRPLIPTEWWIQFEVSYDPEIIPSRQSLIEAAEQAGDLIGLGDWRPRFGRFDVEAT